MSSFGLPLIALFLSTPSARRATSGIGCTSGSSAISIHALREEGDVEGDTDEDALIHFYPRPPRGGRRGMRRGLPGLRNFYPRPPRGGRPNKETSRIAVEFISIHALREEGDAGAKPSRKRALYFYPRPPRGGRQVSAGKSYSFLNHFYPRPPRGGRLADATASIKS